MATSKAPSADPKSSSDLPAEQPQQEKQQTLEEDDEFEDFPVDGTTPFLAAISTTGQLIRVMGKQTGKRMTQKPPRTSSHSISGRSPGTTMTRQMIFPTNSSTRFLLQPHDAMELIRNNQTGRSLKGSRRPRTNGDSIWRANTESSRGRDIEKI